jgi:hypothetical protein
MAAPALLFVGKDTTAIQEIFLSTIETLPPESQY